MDGEIEIIDIVNRELKRIYISNRKSLSINHSIPEYSKYALFIWECIDEKLLDYDAETLKKAISYSLEDVDITRFKDNLKEILKHLDLNKKEDMEHLKFIHEGYSYDSKNPWGNAKEDIANKTKAVIKLILNDKVREKGLTNTLVDLLKNADWGTAKNIYNIIDNTNILDSAYCQELISMTTGNFGQIDYSEYDYESRTYFNSKYSQYISWIIEHDCRSNSGINKRTVELVKLIKNCPNITAAGSASYLATIDCVLYDQIGMNIITKVSEMTLPNNDMGNIISNYTNNFIKDMLKLNENEKSKNELLKKICSAIDLFNNLSLDDFNNMFSDDKRFIIHHIMSNICSSLLRLTNNYSQYYEQIKSFSNKYCKKKETKGIARRKDPNNDK